MASMKSVEVMLKWNYEKNYCIMTAFAHLLHSDHAAKSVIIVKWQNNYFSQMLEPWLDPQEFAAQICLIYQ